MSKKGKTTSKNTTGKKRTTRRGRKRSSNRKLYFGPKTDEAIVQFQTTDCPREKEKLYKEIIQPSFDKLSENLIFIHGFAKNHYSYEALKGDCVSFLYETLQKFDPARGSKAFSYFNVVAKNWLIIQSKKSIKNITRHVSLEDFADMKSADKHAIEKHMIIPSPDDAMVTEENKEILKEMLEIIQKRLSSNNEIVCMKAIMTLFERIDDLDFLNKRAIFIYLRDISNLTPKQLSVAMSNIRKQYREVKKTDETYFSFFF